jgi:hypothetical protein
MSTPVNKLYNFNLSDDAFRELEFVVDRFKKEYVDKAFKSLEILSTLAL